MYEPSEETKTMIHALAEGCDPSTIAALIVDLRRGKYPNDGLAAMAEYATTRFLFALDQKIGTIESRAMVAYCENI